MTTPTDLMSRRRDGRP